MPPFFWDIKKWKGEVYLIPVLFSLVAMAVLLGTDQLIKWWGRTYLAHMEPIVVWDGVFELVYVENRGAAWGILQGKRWLLLVITGIVLALLLCYLVLGKSTHPVETCAVTLIISGRAGNLIDRLFFGYVTDYIYFKPIDFPVFNLADICVVVGTILFCFYWVFLEARRRNRASSISTPKEGEENDSQN